ncbi:DUF4349 domain-containing protein [Agromyces albus]|uniref:DUF4349 domain-containing protein n=1 Tax=Agromyces albus TaxID=205332 RepID=A0A4Q2KUN6_9MICO|nr:DUF4349 domain-containing protein [Agromyces albus]RXZ67131.1 DUF4349 domain-containing protein [Agromyces albus]
MRRLAPVAAAAAILAVLLAGCSFAPDTSGSGGEPAVEAPSREMAPAPESESQDGAATSEFDAQLDDQSMITTGNVSITVDDPVESAEEAADLVEQAGGRVDSRTETPGTDTQPARASLVLRVPSDKLEAVLGELRGLGAVNSYSQESSNVEQQRKDLNARIDALTSSTGRLRQLMAEATSIADLIAIESELTMRQSELDSLTQQRDWLVDQVDFSTLSLELVTEEVAPDPAPDDFWSGVVAGWTALVAFISGLSVAIGVMLPWLLALAIVAAIVIVVVVVSTRRRRGSRGRPEAPVAPSAGGTIGA